MKVTTQEIIDSLVHDFEDQRVHTANRIEAYGIDSELLYKYENALREIASLRLNGTLGANSMALEAVHIAKTAISE